jgi:hypothetical protein
LVLHEAQVQDVNGDRAFITEWHEASKPQTADMDRLDLKNGCSYLLTGMSATEPKQT